MAPVIEVQDLRKHFSSKSGPPWKRVETTVKAVDGVSFTVENNQVVGLVGESGCGKTTVGNLVVNLLEPTGGEVRFRGRDILTMDQEELKQVRKKMQIVFQDPFASLDPRLTLNEVITEPFEIHDLYTNKERIERAGELLTMVGLDSEYGSRYPHELSGGQRQRVAIARALTLDSEVIVADEPTSALDVSVKAQIINLLEELKERIGLSMIFISHDLSMVRHISDHIQVMYFGKIVESGPTEDIFNAPVHPYTRVLLEAIPVPNPRMRRRRKLTLQENRHTSEEMLNPKLTLVPPEPGAEAELREYAPGHMVRCFPSSYGSAG